jgi:hypothetical protein
MLGKVLQDQLTVVQIENGRASVSFLPAAITIGGNGFVSH